MKIGYPIAVRITLGAASVLSSLCAFALLMSMTSPVAASLACAIAGLTVFAFWRCLQPIIEIDANGLTKTFMTGKRFFPRNELLSCDEVVTNPDVPRDVILRFKSGVVSLSAAREQRKPTEVLEYLRRNWNLKLVDLRGPALGRVNSKLDLEYEAIHRFAVAAAATLLAVFGLVSSLLWGCLILSMFCFRTLYFCFCRVAADEEGITFHRPFRAPLKANWADIQSVRYWHSAFTQGGIVLSTKSSKVRIYRWIGSYPMLNRLLRDQLGAEAWPGMAKLPLSVHLNGGRKALIPVLAVVAGAVLTLVPAGVAGDLLGGTLIVPLLLLPLIMIGGVMLSSGRKLEITSDSLTDVYWTLGRRKATVYPRSELVDMRLARQLTVGGLWLRFGYQRLEVTNMDAGMAPEDILATLQRQWMSVPENGRSIADRQESYVLAEPMATR